MTVAAGAVGPGVAVLETAEGGCRGCRSLSRSRTKAMVDERRERAGDGTYVALGDSISTDDYADGAGRGGASLQAVNRDDAFPSWGGRDLAVPYSICAANLVADCSLSVARTTRSSPFWVESSTARATSEGTKGRCRRGPRPRVEQCLRLRRPVTRAGTWGPCVLQEEAPNAGKSVMGARLATSETAWLSPVRLPPAYPRNATGVVSGIA
jgi:hypothetical protein